MAAGADAASQMDAAFRQIIDNDPEIQAVIRGVWGNATRDERPSDTPKNLEKANAAASKQIGQILARKGITLPDRTFINPRSGTIEGHRGWAGLSGIQKAAILAAAGVATGGALSAAGAFGGAAGGAAGGGGSAAAGAAGAAGPSMIMPGMATSLSAGTLAGLGGGGTAAAAGAAGGGGLLASLGSALGSKAGVGSLLQGVGAVAGGIGKNQAAERAAGVDYSILRDKLGLDASQQNESATVNRADQNIRERAETRTDLNNAFEKSLQANLIKSWPGAPSMPDRIPTFNLGATGPTQDARNSASEMDRQMMVKILGGGGKGAALPEFKPYELQSPATLPGASTSEKLMDLIGLGGTAVGNFLDPPDSTANFQKWLKQFQGGTA